MFASIPNYKEFYIENDLNKQAGVQAVTCVVVCLESGASHPVNPN